MTENTQKVDGNAPMYESKSVGDISMTTSIPIRLEIASRILVVVSNPLSPKLAQQALNQADLLIKLHNESLES